MSFSHSIDYDKLDRKVILLVKEKLKKTIEKKEAEGKDVKKEIAFENEINDYLIKRDAISRTNQEWLEEMHNKGIKVAFGRRKRRSKRRKRRSKRRSKNKRRKSKRRSKR